jgi:hypothetical protein
MVLAIVHGLIFAAGVVLDAASPKLAQVCCARHQHRDLPSPLTDPSDLNLSEIAEK